MLNRLQVIHKMRVCRWDRAHILFLSMVAFPSTSPDQYMKHFIFCEIILLFNISDRCPAGPSGVAICPFLLLCKCAHPILVVRERIRDERYPS